MLNTDATQLARFILLIFTSGGDCLVHAEFMSQLSTDLGFDANLLAWPEKLL